MGCVQNVLQTFRRIDWRSAREITPEAEAFIAEHIEKMRAVFRYLRETRKLGPLEAYAKAQSAGHSAPGYGPFMDALFDEIDFRGAGVREHIILAAASYCFWLEDPELGDLENPWAPVMKLYQSGYTTSFDENEKDQTMTLLIGYRNDIKSYPLT